MGKQVDKVNQNPAPGADDVLEAIHAVMHLFRARQHRGLREGAQELTHMEAKTMGFFARHPGATQSELVQRMGRDKGQVARLISGLRERGLLESQPDEADRRVQRLQLGPAGQAVHAAMLKRSRLLSAQAVLGLSEDERQTLLQLLARVRSNLETD